MHPTTPTPHGLRRYASPRSQAEHLRHVRDRLHTRFDALDGVETVDDAVDEATSHFAHARIETFVPVLVERIARARLTAQPPAGRVNLGLTASSDPT